MKNKTLKKKHEDEELGIFDNEGIYYSSDVMLTIQNMMCCT